MERLLWVKSSPHMRDDETTRLIMGDVILALTPALAMASYVFGFRVLALLAVSAASCVGFEFLYRLAMKKNSSIGDLSALVTAILLVFCLPVSAPLWIPVVGGFFAIVVVKQLYGGLGHNFVNPTLAARAFLFSWPGIMTAWTAAYDYPETFSVSPAADMTTSPTLLPELNSGIIPENTGILDLLLGNRAGCIGEGVALMLIAGGLYLLYRRIITLHIPAAYIGTVAAVTYFFPINEGVRGWTFVIYELLSGGLLLGAIFMATDYATSPVTRPGKIVYGIGCGFLTVIIRYFGGYPEGVTYAILLMNLLTWFIDRYVRPRRFGGVSAQKPSGGGI